MTTTHQALDEVATSSFHDEQSIHKAVVAGAEFLPSQGPITAFTFLNPLASLENTSFEEALRQVPELFGCEPYLPEFSYRKMLDSGRILDGELRDILLDELAYSASETVAGIISRADFRLSLLKNSLQSGNDE